MLSGMNSPSIIPWLRRGAMWDIWQQDRRGRRPGSFPAIGWQSGALVGLARFLYHGSLFCSVPFVQSRPGSVSAWMVVDIGSCCLHVPYPHLQMSLFLGTQPALPNIRSDITGRPDLSRLSLAGLPVPSHRAISWERSLRRSESTYSTCPRSITHRTRAKERIRGNRSPDLTVLDNLQLGSSTSRTK
jgi:hypothetical protein